MWYVVYANYSENFRQQHCRVIIHHRIDSIPMGKGGRVGWMEVILTSHCWKPFDLMHLDEVCLDTDVVTLQIKSI